MPVKEIQTKFFEKNSVRQAFGAGEKSAVFPAGEGLANGSFLL
ncbi:hypothetical protein [uncultured Mailhella sp.]|nr:hypothetical protein [uncultured Mailhella sp.]